jgi:hypothetical protein
MKDLIELRDQQIFNTINYLNIPFHNSNFDIVNQ